MDQSFPPRPVLFINLMPVLKPSCIRNLFPNFWIAYPMTRPRLGITARSLDPTSSTRPKISKFRSSRSYRRGRGEADWRMPLPPSFDQWPFSSAWEEWPDEKPSACCGLSGLPTADAHELSRVLAKGTIAPRPTLPKLGFRVCELYRF